MALQPGNFNRFFFFSYLATGNSFRDLAIRFRLGRSTVSLAIQETCQAIWEVLQPTEMPPPTTEMFKKIEQVFATRWNFPNCCGAVDGKHVMIQCPPNSGSLYFNYKGYYSINLMALVDATYRFIIVDIGQYGSNADGGVFRRSEMGSRFFSYCLGLPPPKELPNAAHLGKLHHCIVGDEAFPLHINLLRPYPRPRKGAKLPKDQLIFNYRLCRARRCVENAFGILAQRFRLFNRRIQMKPENVVRIVKACTVLHNYLRDNKSYLATSLELNPDREPFLPDDGPVQQMYNIGYHSSKAIRANRDLFKRYFNGVGKVHWQREAALNV